MGAGWIVKGIDTRHTIYKNPANGAKAPVPRHAEIDNCLARKICQELGITQSADGPRSRYRFRMDSCHHRVAVTYRDFHDPETVLPGLPGPRVLSARRRGQLDRHHCGPAARHPAVP